MSDANVKMEIVAAVYPNTFEAQATLSDLLELHKSGAIELIDAAVMVREYTGDLTIKERAELTPAKGARRGALIGAVLGVVFPPSLLASAALGAAAGAVTGKVTDQGLANEMLDDLSQDLEPGKSAVLAVIEHTVYEEMLEAMDGYQRIVNRSYWADEAGRIEL